MEVFSKISDSDKIKFFDAVFGLINTDNNGGETSKPASPEKVNLNTILENLKSGQKVAAEDSSPVKVIDTGKKQKTLDSWLIKSKNASPSKNNLKELSCSTEIQTDTILCPDSNQTHETSDDTLNNVLENCQDSGVITESNPNVTDYCSLPASKHQENYISNSLNQSNEESPESKLNKSANLNDASRLISNVNSVQEKCFDSNQVTASNEICVNYPCSETSMIIDNKFVCNEQSSHKSAKCKSAQMCSTNNELVDMTEKYNLRKNRKRKKMFDESAVDECYSTIKSNNMQDNNPISSCSEIYNCGNKDLTKSEQSVTPQCDLLPENMKIDVNHNNCNNLKESDNQNLRIKKKDLKLNSVTESSVEFSNSTISDVTNENVLPKANDQETTDFLSNSDVIDDVYDKVKDTQMSSSNVESVNVPEKYNLRRNKKKRKKYCELTFLHECKTPIKLDRNNDNNLIDNCDNKELIQSKTSGYSAQCDSFLESMEIDTNQNYCKNSKESDCQSTNDSNTNKSPKQRAKKKEFTLNGLNESSTVFSNCILPHIDSSNKNVLQRVNNRGTTVSSSHSGYEAFRILNAECSQIGLNILDILTHEKIQNLLNDNEKISNEAVVLLGSFKSSSDKTLPVVHLIESKKKLFGMLNKFQKKAARKNI